MTVLTKYFEELTYLKVVIEQGSINRAAMRLGISQPALTRSIKRLENYLRVRLLDRTARGVSPTAFGEVLVNHIRPIDSELDRAVASLEALKSGNSSVIRCGGTLGSLNWLLPAALNELQRSRPNMSAHVTEGIPAVLLTMLRQGELDVAVLPKWDDLPEPNLVSYTVGVDCVHVFARKQHPLHALRNNVLAAMTQSERWIMPNAAGTFYQSIKREFERRKVDMPSKVVQTTSYAMLISLLRTTDHIAITTSQTVGHELAEGILKPIRGDANDLMDTRIVAYHRSDVSPGPVATALIKSLQRIGRRYRPLIKL